MKKLSILLTLLTACGGAAANDVATPPAEATSEDALLSRTGDYRVEGDTRKCAFPICGGYYVSLVNQSRTRCADGTTAASCYVASIDWSALGLTREHTEVVVNQARAGKVLVRGSLTSRYYRGFGTFGELVARRAWEAATDVAPSGSFYGARDNGIVCVGYPCFNVTTTLLNDGTTNTVSGIDLAASGATQAQQDAAIAALRRGDLIVAGVIRRDIGTRATGRTLAGSQFYLPIEPLECVGDAECTSSAYTKPVRSRADCYCPSCPEPIAARDAAANEASWNRFCARRTLQCPLVLCIEPPPVACVEGVCSASP